MIRQKPVDESFCLTKILLNCEISGPERSIGPHKNQYDLF